MTKRLGQYYAEADRIRRDRIKLSRMNDRQLADIGLTRYDVQCEYNRFMI
ncbi:MAG: DUF1127 domain-containing protein [Gammaproteobacteria bacterium]|nr:DUF1127 domain-containing protein [Gammaproteobacteria bacterium]